MYQYLEQISMVPKMFEPLRFNCNMIELSNPGSIVFTLIRYWDRPEHTVEIRSDATRHDPNGCTWS